MNLKVSPEFREFAADYVDESDDFSWPMERTIAFAIKHMPARASRLALYEFLGQLLDQDYSEAEMRRVWINLAPGVAYEDGTYRYFFGLVRTMLAAELGNDVTSAK